MLPDVLERQGLYLNLLSKLIIFLILKKYFCVWIFSGVFESFRNSWEIVQYWTIDYTERSRIKVQQCNWTE